MKKLFVTLLISSTVVSAGAQSARNEPDSTTRYYNRLSDSELPADKAILETHLYKLLQSAKEQDWLTARRYFYRIKKNNTVDSINAAALKRFPVGQVSRSKEVTLVYDEKDAVKKEAAYKAWIAKFPPGNETDEDIEYDYARFGLATAYADDSNLVKALEYAHAIKNPIWQGEGLAGTANRLLAKGFKKEGFDLYQEARTSAFKSMNMPGAGGGRAFAANNFLYYSTAIANMLYKDNKPQEAYPYIKTAYDSAKVMKPNLNTTYFDVALALGKKKEAFEVAIQTIEAGQGTTKMKANLKQLYIDNKGSDAGYDNYLATMNKALLEKLRKEVVGKMIDKPAPDVTFTDVNGKPVSLKDMKDKIVVLDFWATWCGPCKKSFPAMKMAVEKYKANPGVQFLFIHTWEKVAKAEATESAVSFVKEQKYPFEVWMDLKDDATGINKGVDGYKVNGIPAKFVIDKKGHIRFALTGFSGGDDAAVEELSTMIEMAAKG